MSTEIGQIKKNGVSGLRDAFHVPAILATCDETLEGGTSVRFTDKELTIVEDCEAKYRHGVIDPFLGAVQPGELFWVLLNPGLVTSLNHEFKLDLDNVPIPDEIQDDGDDDSCRGCYGESYDDDDDDGACRGCY